MGNESNGRGGDVLVMERHLDTTPQKAFEAWTVESNMKQWFGPKDFTLPECTIDLRVGGKMHCCMQSPEGQRFWSGGEYLTIKPGEFLETTDYFSDEEGNVVSPTKYGIPEGWPEVASMAITFSPAADGGTDLRVEHRVPLDLAKQIQCDIGWQQTLDNLEKFVNKD